MLHVVSDGPDEEEEHQTDVEGNWLFVCFLKCSPVFCIRFFRKVFNICAFLSNRHCIIAELSGFLHYKTNYFLFCLNSLIYLLFY